MNKCKLLVAVAVAGLLGTSARAAVTGYDPVTIKGTVLVQTNATHNGSTTKYNVIKLKIVNKDILKFIANEFEETFPAGAQLAVNNYWQGEFYVLDKAGNEIRFAGHTYLDDYELYISKGNHVYTGSETPSKETYNSTGIATLYYSDANDYNYFSASGLVTVKDTYSTKDSESFKLTGAGNGYILDDYDTVVSGTLSGSGKNADD